MTPSSSSDDTRHKKPKKFKINKKYRLRRLPIEFGSLLCLYLAGMENIDEKACLCALNKIFGFEPKIALALISHCGSAEAVFRLGDRQIDELMGPYSKYRRLIGKPAVRDAVDELRSCEKMGIAFTGITEDTYPQILTECPDPSIGLYIRSDTPLEDLWPSPAGIAIVGTRDISPYGREWCSRIVEGLANTKDKPLIVSGLALGTDICAHRTALEHGLPTIAVMATGADSIYPLRHTDFAEKIRRAPGSALITDYPLGTAPLAIHFLRRNRIIAGLSRATILIESKLKGGGMMTTKLAFSYDRDVYALPGRVDDIRSQGCNQLISNKIAEPITSTPSLIKNLGMKAASRQTSEAANGKVGELAEILLYIRNNRGATIEEIATACNMTYSKAAAAISTLELDGLITVDLLQRCSIMHTFAG